MPGADRILLLSLLAVFAALPAPAQERLVLERVSVVPMDAERVLREQTVLIEDGRIAAVGVAGTVAVPAEARVIDAADRYLMPGLAEMHAHVPGSAADEQYRRDVLFLYLANGVTLIRGMQGDPIHVDVREQLARGETLGPRLITAGPSFSPMRAPDPERATEMVREQAAAGYDFIKVSSGTRAAFDAMVAAAREHGLPFSGHVPDEVGVPGALEAGYASIDHLDMYMETLVDAGETDGIDGGYFGYRLAPYAQPERMRDIVRRTRDAGVWNVPTETLMHAVMGVELDGLREARPEFRYMPASIVDGWFETIRQRRESTQFYEPEASAAFLRVRIDLLHALDEAGAGLLLGSDAPQFFNVPGFSLHREMAVLADGGFSPFRILQMGTVGPAEFFGEGAEAGLVAPGMRADLVLLDANPLEDIRNARRIAGVLIHGRWLGREEIDAGLAEIAARNAR